MPVCVVRKPETAVLSADINDMAHTSWGLARSIFGCRIGQNRISSGNLHASLESLRNPCMD